MWSSISLPNVGGIVGNVGWMLDESLFLLKSIRLTPSTTLFLFDTWKCKWFPVEYPVVPTVAISCQLDTLSPFFTFEESGYRWPYKTLYSISSTTHFILI